MALNSKHPLYTERAPEWEQMRDTYEGQRRVKARGFVYLAPTSSMEKDGVYTGTGADVNTASPGWRAYVAYRMRATFPEWVREAVKAALGVMHRKAAGFELPPQMEYLLERATPQGESLQTLFERITMEQLIVGRIGLLGDAIDQGARAGEVYVSTYDAENLINWDHGESGSDLEIESLNLVVLDESGKVRKGFEWVDVKQYRVLVLGAPDVNEEDQTAGAGAVYRLGVFTDTSEFNETALIEPVIRGKKAFDLPFVIVNAQDLAPSPDVPPTFGLSNLALTYYRASADYRQNLFMQGQDTLVVIGSITNGGTDSDEDLRVGAGARIDLAIGGDAKYIGVNSQGLAEQRVALENDRTEALQKAGQLLDTTSKQRESAEALTVRVAVRTATLVSIAKAAAGGLQALLRKLAAWSGYDAEAVVVKPNLDFVDQQLTGEELGQLMGAKMVGAPLSIETVHAIMQDRGMTKLTLEEELAKIEEEKALELVPVPSGNPDGPANDGPNDPNNDDPNNDDPNANGDAP